MIARQEGNGYDPEAENEFIALALTSLFVLLSAIVIGMNLLNYSAVVEEADKVLSLLSQNQGTLPEFERGRNEWVKRGMSPELPYEARFFSVLVGNSGEVLRAETTRIYAIDESAAAQYAREAVEQGKAGFENQ